MNQEKKQTMFDDLIKRNLNLLKYFDRKTPLVILSKKNLFKILSETIFPTELLNIIIDFVMPNLDKMYIKDTRDLYNQMTNDESNIYTQLLGNKWYPIPSLDMTNIHSKSLVYCIRSSFMYVILYYLLLDFNIYIVKGQVDYKIIDKIKDSQTVCFNFSCVSSSAENTCYRLLLEKNARR